MSLRWTRDPLRDDLPPLCLAPTGSPPTKRALLSTTHDQSFSRCSLNLKHIRRDDVKQIDSLMQVGTATRLTGPVDLASVSIAKLSQSL